MTIDDVRARAARLEALSRGLMKERAVIGEADDPLLYLERRAYVVALTDAVGGIEAARVTLAKALARLGGRSGQGTA